jgi:guanylate kinase
LSKSSVPISDPRDKQEPDPSGAAVATPVHSRLTVLSGPSGVGKSTVVAELRRICPEIWISVSVTTRGPRPGEVGGREYHFVDDGEFDRLIASGALLEWAWFAGYRYGTPRAPLTERLEAGVACLLEIDVAGARQVRRAAPDARLVFLAPPSWDELVRRLTGRGTEPPEVLARRLAAAEEELAAAEEFDVTLVNTSVQDVAQQLITLMAECALSSEKAFGRHSEAAEGSGRQNVAGTQPLGAADGIINPPIDELLDVVDSKYQLVIMAAKRARQINAYYAQLGEGLLEYVGPLVETRSQEKPLSISLREIKERLLNVEPTEG